MAEFAYTKLRSEFGRQCSFGDRIVEVLANIKPNEAQAAEYIRRNPVSRGNQISTFEHFSEHYVSSTATWSILLLLLLYYYFLPSVLRSRGSLKINYAIQMWVRSSVRAVSGRQTIVQQNSIEALHQNRNPLK